MARSISSSISTLRSSLSDIRTAFSNVNVSVPSSLKVSEVDDYIKQIETPYPSVDIGITGPDFNSAIKNKMDITDIRKVTFLPYSLYNQGKNKFYTLGDSILVGDLVQDVLYIMMDGEKVYHSTDRKLVKNRFKLKSGYKMFMDFTSLQEVDFSQVDFSGVTDCDSMFKNCSNLRSVNFIRHDFSNVTDMRDMFNNCPELRAVQFDPNIIITPTYLQNMFYKCTMLTQAHLPFNPKNISNINSMFYECIWLQYLTVSSSYKNWTTNSKVQSGTDVFYNCNYLPHSGSGEYCKYAGDGGNFYTCW